LFVAFAFWRSGDVTFINKGTRAVILVRTFLFVPLVVYWFSFAFGLILTDSSVFFGGYLFSLGPPPSCRGKTA
jgi:hypothetical protein